jgi:hypothetical protein
MIGQWHPWSKPHVFMNSWTCHLVHNSNFNFECERVHLLLKLLVKNVHLSHIGLFVCWVIGFFWFGLVAS